MSLADEIGWYIVTSGYLRIGVFQPKSDRNRPTSSPRFCYGVSTLELVKQLKSVQPINFH
ncbi:hypothetical protein MTR_5g083580 [Medicago truncatula]|uniref:Uncharacterized protein n=1 Tax=Medicago truncatula TaxID=3880 RepID=G7K7A1_MEDTR|nr:hypothetical protein MTR_5g083580 [Medicago truncatula]